MPLSSMRQGQVRSGIRDKRRDYRNRFNLISLAVTSILCRVLPSHFISRK